MTVPSFVGTGFAFTQLAGVTDVQTIINAVTTMLTATLSNTPTGVYPSGERWSAVGGGPVVYTAPSDNGGRFMKLTLGRTAVNRLQFKYEDPSGVLADGELDIDVTGTAVNIFGGPGHVWIEADNAGTWEVCAVFMVDPTPEPLAASSTFVFGRVWRNNTGAVISGNNNGDTWIGRYTGGASYNTLFYTNACRPRIFISDNSNGRLRTVAGSDVVAPMYMGNDSANFGGNWINTAKIYQAIVVDSNQLAGAILMVPVDVGVTAQFQVSHLPAFGSCALALRKA